MAKPVNGQRSSFSPATCNGERETWNLEGLVRPGHEHRIDIVELPGGRNRLHELGKLIEQVLPLIGSELVHSPPSLDRHRVGVGLEVAPLFGTYGVFRTSSDNENSTYVALGFILDEYIMDESETLDGINDSGLSYGFGVNKSSYKLEYMMYVDEEDYAVSAISLGIVSEF